MLALRSEAIQLVNELPENLLVEVVQNLRDLKNKIANKTELAKKNVVEQTFSEEEFQNFLNSGSGIDPKKAIAFAKLEMWRKNNKVNLPVHTDWKKEIMKVAEEKHDYFDWFQCDFRLLVSSPTRIQ